MVVCDSRLAAQWQAAFREAGIDAAVIETDTDEADGGACKVTVPRARRVEASAIVTAVTRGERRLPAGAVRLDRRGLIALVVVAIFVVGLVFGALAR